MKAYEIVGLIDPSEVEFTNKQLTTKVENLSKIIDALCEHLNVEICFTTKPSGIDFVIVPLDCKQMDMKPIMETPSEIALKAGYNPRGME